MKKIITTAAALLLPITGLAADQETAPLPPAESIEPEIIISPSDDRQVKEYRVNGQLYMIEITPTKGPSYYLVDMDGDGILETRHGAGDPGLVIPRWTLLRW